MTDQPVVVCAIADPHEDLGLATSAAELAQALSLPLRLLHVRRLQPAMPPAAGLTGLAAGALGPAVAPPPTHEDRAALEALARRAGAPDAEIEVTDGLVGPLLAEAGRRSATAWLVLGDGGRTTLSAALRGSVTRQLLAVPGCPLLVVPDAPSTHATPQGEAIVCFVADDPHAEATCAVGAALADALAGRLVVVHAVAGDVEAAARDEAVAGLLARCRTVAERRGVAVRTQLAAGDHLEGLLAAGRAAGARLLVVGGPGHAPVMAALVKETPHHLVAAAWDPVVVVRDR